MSWLNSSEHFELAAPQVLPIVVFRVKNGGLSGEELAVVHEEIVDQVTADGQRWISETKIRGESVIRMMVISYLTEERHIMELEKALTAAAKKATVALKTR